MEGCVQACSRSGICSNGPNPMWCLNPEMAEWGRGCSADHTSGEKSEKVEDGL
jgi:hypothetical protein